MKVLVASIVLSAGLVGPAVADYSLANRPPIVFPGPRGDAVHISPYPMSKRAAAVWASNACWRGCTAQAGWRYDACLNVPPVDQDACRAALDAEDRACLRSCRTRGGPILNITD